MRSIWFEMQSREWLNLFVHREVSISLHLLVCHDNKFSVTIDRPSINHTIYACSLCQRHVSLTFKTRETSKNCTDTARWLRDRAQATWTSGYVCIYLHATHPFSTRDLALCQALVSHSFAHFLSDPLFAHPIPHSKCDRLQKITRLRPGVHGIMIFFDMLL